MTQRPQPPQPTLRSERAVSSLPTVPLSWRTQAARCSNIYVRSLHWRHIAPAPCSAARRVRTLSCMRVSQLREVHYVSLFSILC